MPRLALKPDFSFFRKIALGAVGSRHVAQDLERLGHRIVELERGAMDTKLWKDVQAQARPYPGPRLRAVRASRREPCEDEDRFVDVP